MRLHRAVSWVVYQFTLKGKPAAMKAVCEQAEWEEMELGRPGFFTLIKSGIRDEGVAERLARGTSGDPIPRMHRVLYGTPLG